MALNIKDDNFEAVVAEGKPIVLDFGLHGVDLVNKSLHILKNWQRNIRIR